MQNIPYTQDISSAFEDVVGDAGASRERYRFWLNTLEPVIARIKARPVAEAKSIFATVTNEDDLQEIEEVAANIRSNFKTLLVVGMGGSSLSGETLGHLRRADGVQLRFLDNIDPYSFELLLQEINWKETAALIISKSGKTVETLAQMAVLLRDAKRHLPDVGKHFTVVTIPNNNPMHELAKTHGMRVVGHDVKLCGRFSIFSAVGLIPAAAAGVDIRALRAGARATLDLHLGDSYLCTPAAQAAALQRALMEKQIGVSVLMHYADRLSGLGLWVRQAWAESLGKCDKATIPVPSRGTTDQHSQQQLYLDGPRDKFFSALMLDTTGQGAAIGFDSKHDTRLNFLQGHTLGDLLLAEQRASVDTLIARGCPVRLLSFKSLNEELLGAMLMHFTLEVMFTAELLGVNAFDQPAVEESKIRALEYLAGGQSAGGLKRSA